jgi:squalene synthase HpnC
MSCPIADVRRSLERFGPDRCESVSESDARAWCRALAWGHYENFSVLSSIVPAELKDDFGAVYAFCRWSDDLGDEIGDRERSTALLAWWREELQACFAGAPRHPVMVALRGTIARYDLPYELFDRLIRAFELDQVKTRYETWDEVLGYCRDSADPVGRLVLMMLGEPRSDELFGLSDRLCTALQLTNHWQDIRRDAAERDRIYVPMEMVRAANAGKGIDDFERRLFESIRLGHGCDATFFGESRELVRSLVAKTWPLFEEGEHLFDRLTPRSRPVVWLLAAGGARTLRQIELWNCETVLHRPYLSKPSKVWLVLRAWWIAKRQRREAATLGHGTRGDAA